MNETYAAIDLGTMNIKFAFYDPNKVIGDEEPEWKRIIILDTGFNSAEMMKNIVSLKPGECHVGMLRPRDGWVNLYDVKTHLTEEAWVLECEGQDRLSITEVLEKEYGYLWNTNHVNRLPEAKGVTLTVPVNFTELQCRKMRRAAEEAGIPVREVITEPFAALFGCDNILEQIKEELIGKKKSGKNPLPKRIMIFDGGAGTLDACIFEMSLTKDDRLRVKTLASKGCSLGGNVLTQWLYEDLLKVYVAPALKSRVMKDMEKNIISNPAIPEEEKQEGSNLYQRNFRTYQENNYNRFFRDGIEDLKQRVCIRGKSAPDEAEDYNAGGMNAGEEQKVTYTQFTNVLGSHHMREDLTEFMDELMKNAGFYYYVDVNDREAKLVTEVDQLDQIIAIGGSSQIPYFQNFLKEYFAMEGADESSRFLFSGNANRAYNSVAAGAVIYQMNKEAGWYELLNRLAYEIGVVENGRYSCVRSMSITVGRDNFPSQGAIVTPEAGADGRPIVKLYQLFDNTQLEPWLMVLLKENHKLLERAVFMGYFALDMSNFAVGTPCKMMVTVDTDGTVRGHFCTDNSENYDKEFTLTMEV